MNEQDQCHRPDKGERRQLRGWRQLSEKQVEHGKRNKEAGPELQRPLDGPVDIRSEAFLHRRPDILRRLGSELIPIPNQRSGILVEILRNTYPRNATGRMMEIPT